MQRLEFWPSPSCELNLTAQNKCPLKRAIAACDIGFQPTLVGIRSQAGNSFPDLIGLQALHHQINPSSSSTPTNTASPDNRSGFSNTSTPCPAR
jgi:hypothetical protein